MLIKIKELKCTLAFFVASLLIALFIFQGCNITQAHAGMDFTGFNEDKAQTVNVPIFKNSDEAIKYGKNHQGDKDIAYTIYIRWKLSEEMAKFKYDHGATKAGFKFAIKAQLYHEALQAMGDVGASTYSGEYPIKGES